MRKKEEVPPISQRIMTTKQRIQICFRAIVVKKTIIHPQAFGDHFFATVTETTWRIFGIPFFFHYDFKLDC